MNPTRPSLATNGRRKPLANADHISQAIIAEARPFLQHAASQAGALVERGAAAIVSRSNQLRARSRRASAGTVKYTQEQPVKSVLIAATLGAAVAAVLSRRKDQEPGQDPGRDPGKAR